MERRNFTQIAAAGLISGAILTKTGLARTKNAYSLKEIAAMKPDFVDGKFKATHSCSGINVCKGLGGCGVDKKKLEKLSKKMKVPKSKAGKPHDCSGLNECKGLGGCKVDAKKFEKLKKKVLAKK